MPVGIKQKDIKRITLGYFLKLGASLGTEQFVQFRPILVDRVFSSNSFSMSAMRSLPFIWFCIVTSIWAKRPVSISLAAVQAVNVSISDSLFSVVSGFRGAC